MNDDSRLYCAACREPLALDQKAGRREECPRCGAELHACVQCRNYDPRLSRPCREPQALAEETIRDPARANFCAWFEHRRGLLERETGASGEQAKAAFDALFGGKRPTDEPTSSAAAFDKLFKH